MVKHMAREFIVVEKYLIRHFIHEIQKLFSFVLQYQTRIKRGKYIEDFRNILVLPHCITNHTIVFNGFRLFA